MSKPLYTSKWTPYNGHFSKVPFRNLSEKDLPSRQCKIAVAKLYFGCYSLFLKEKIEQTTYVFNNFI